MTSMHIDMPKQLRDFLQSEVKSGNYSNESEVVRDAIRRLQERKSAEEKNNTKLENLRAELELGVKDFKEGRFAEYTPQLLEDIKSKAMIKSKNKIPPKASVVPNDETSS